MDKLKAVLSLLIEEKPLPARYHDHPLQGEWKGFRDLHIEPDWRATTFPLQGKVKDVRPSICDYGVDIRPSFGYMQNLAHRAASTGDGRPMGRVRF